MLDFVRRLMVVLLRSRLGLEVGLGCGGERANIAGPRTAVAHTTDFPTNLGGHVVDGTRAMLPVVRCAARHDQRGQDTRGTANRMRVGDGPVGLKVPCHVRQEQAE